MIDDPKIKVDTSQAKMIAEIVCKEIITSRTSNAKHYARCKRCENQYNQVTKWMERGVECNNPWDGAADYFVPLTEWIIDAVWARVVNILFSQEPYMTAVGVEASDVDKAPGVTEFVDMAFREIINVYDSMSFFFKQMIKLPFAVCRFDWQQEFDRIITKEKAQVFVRQGENGEPEEEYVLPDDPDVMSTTMELMANGYQQSQETKDVWVSQDKELVNAPQLRYIRADDYVFSPYAKRGTRLYWEGDRIWLTLNDMRLKVIQEKFIKDQVEKIETSLNLKGEGSEKAINQRSALIECYNWFGRLPFNKSNEIDFQDPEAIEQEVSCIVALKEKSLLQITHWQYNRLPYPDRVYIRDMFEETEGFSGRSLSEKLFMTNKELNAFHNTIMNNAWMAMQKVIVKKKGLQGDDWDEQDIYPGAILEEHQTGDIHMLEMGDIKTIGFEIEQALLNFAERVSNISIFQTGTERQAGGQKTKGEVLATIEEGNLGLDKFIQRCHNVLRKVCKWTVDYYYDRMPPGLERRIRGENGEMIFPTEQNMGMYQEKGINPVWEDDDLAGKYDFTWQGTAISGNKKLQIALSNDLMDRYMPQPMIQQNMLATWEILKRGFIARDIKDWQKILPSREAVIAEMEKMKLEAQAQKQRQAAEAQQPGKVVQQLVGKGMPVQQAKQAVVQNMEKEDAGATA